MSYVSMAEDRPRPIESEAQAIRLACELADRYGSATVNGYRVFGRGMETSLDNSDE